MIDKNKNITVVLIMILIAIRVAFAAIINYAYVSPPLWAIDILDIGVYCIAGLLIILQKENLESFHINRASLWIFILSGTLLRLDLRLISVIAWIVGLILFWLLISRRFDLSPMSSDDVLWSLRGLLLGFALSIAVATLSKSLNLHTYPVAFQKPSLLLWSIAFFFELSHVAIQEEILFRGFLWGYLRTMNWQPESILLFQAGLFWLAHINYLDRPFTFWVIVPIMGIILGAMASRSRSVAPSAILHAMYNSMRYFL